MLHIVKNEERRMRNEEMLHSTFYILRPEGATSG